MTLASQVKIEPRPENWRMKQHLSFELDVMVGKHPNYGQRFKPDASHSQKIKYEYGQAVLDEMLREGNGWYQNIGISQYAPIKGRVDLLWTNGRIYKNYNPEEYNWMLNGGIVAFRPVVESSIQLNPKR